MSPALVCVAVTLLGVDPGWQRLEDGGWRYLIQIDPATARSLKPGDVIESDVPPQLRDIRSYRIVVGTGELPRDKPLGPAAQREPNYRMEPSPGTVGLEKPNGSDPGPSAFVPPEVPGRFPSAPDSKPLAGQRAAYEEQLVAKPELETPPATAGAPADEPGRPWMPFTLALSAAFGCFGGMVYLGWIAWDYRQRYRALFRRMLDAGLAMADEPAR